jgi:hypothetical protein
MTINLTQLIYHKHQFFTKEECEFLIDEHKKLESTIELEHCLEATSGIDTYSTFKRVKLQYGSEAFNLSHKKTEQIINEYMDYLEDMGMFHIALRDSMLYSHMHRLLRYDVGNKIHPHTDHHTHVYGSCTFNLNDGYTGGDFKFWNGKHKVALGVGDGLIFPADFFWVHEVSPILSGSRYSTNCFLMNIPPSMKTESDNFLNHMYSHEKGGTGKFKDEVNSKYQIKKSKNETKVG